jgi:four helix bundle protein
MPGVSYRNLVIWQKAIQLVVESYRISDALPSIERFGLVQQIRRAAVSIPANIAEGHGRSSMRDFSRFVSMARGSVTELETHFEIGCRLGFATEQQMHVATALCGKISRMAGGLQRSIRSRPATRSS